MSKIAFLDLKHYYESDRETFNQAFENFMARGQFILGPEVEQFEKNFAKYLGAKHAWGVSNGLDAIVLSLKALNIGTGDEVIVPAHTFIATWFAVSQTGATPIPVEVQESTYNIDPDRVDTALTTRTKAIIGVHLYGKAFEAAQLREYCDRKNLFLIEDAAQAHGTEFGNRKAGTFGHLAAFSFYPGKNLGAYGDAGAITSNSDAWVDQISQLRNYGSSVKYHHDTLGFNCRLDELQAALLNIRLKRLDEDNSKRQALAEQYDRRLKGIGDLILPTHSSDGKDAWHLYVVRTNHREKLMRNLSDNGITTLIHYPIPCHLSKAYEFLKYKKGAFPITERICETVFSLPMGPHLTSDDVDVVCDQIEKFFA